MHRYECGKYNINYYLKETFIWGNLRCSANGGKNIQGKKVYWKLKIILGQLLSMNVALSQFFSYYAFEIFLNICLQLELKLNQTTTILYPYLNSALALLLQEMQTPLLSGNTVETV